MRRSSKISISALVIAILACGYWIRSAVQGPSSDQTSTGSSDRSTEASRIQVHTDGAAETNSSIVDDAVDHSAVRDEGWRSPGLTILVVNTAGVPVPGATIAVARGSTDPLETIGTTNESGEFRVVDDLSSEDVLYIHVVAHGYASIHLIRPNLDEAHATCRIVLRPAGTLHVRTLDEGSGATLAKHWVTVRFAGQTAEPPDDASSFPVGTQIYQTHITDERGLLILDDLECGYWIIQSEEWRQQEESREFSVNVGSGNAAHIDVASPAMSSSTFAAGRVVLPRAVNLGPFGTTSEFVLDSLDGEHKAHWLYEDGQFVVRGAPNTVLELRVIDLVAHKESHPVSVSIGSRNATLRPVW